MNETMGAIIARKRKELGLTQEQLANTLNISFQAVSKWENELSSPDISTLPLLADLFGVTIDELFGREAPQLPVAEERALVPAPSNAPDGVELPWPDDDTLHAVLFIGRQLVAQEDVGKRPVTLHISGDALNVQSAFDVEVEGEVGGNISAGGDVDCSGVGGDVQAGGSVDCERVLGHVKAGDDVSCDNVEGNVSAGGDVSCDNVAGSVSAGGDVSCDNVGGSVRAMGDVNCG